MALEPNVHEVRHLLKRYGGLTAVHDVSFALRRGTCFGLLGPNGAGKTTTVEIAEGVLRADGGEVLYQGAPRGASFKAQVGIQFQQTALLQFLTVRETLETFGRLFPRRADLDSLVALCHLEDVQGSYNDRISGGQRQRLMLALALVNRPELVFLDEPSTGLDPQARHDLWRLIAAIKGEGKTVVLTTHYMEEAQRLCDEVAIMDGGRIIARGTPDDLIRRHGGLTRVRLPRRLLGDGAPERLAPLGAVLEGEALCLPTRDIHASLRALMALGVDLDDLTVQSPNLEQVFLNLTGRHLRD
jgi:ABC-2 type transport system ATP-binding protein